MKKVLTLIGIVLPSLYGETLTYPDDITSFAFEWGNPDLTTTVETGPDDGSLMTDGDILTGELLDNPSTTTGTWGTTTANTNGMVGTFYASTLESGATVTFWRITSAKIVFSSGGCFKDRAVAEFYYEDLSGTPVVNNIEVTKTVVDGTPSTTHFEAEIPADGILTNGAIGFSVASNHYCEGEIRIYEFVLEGESVLTTDPTPAPSPLPTMAPTSDCSGEVTWGDPHFRLMGFNNDKVPQFNYQELGWFYYIFPCDMDLYEEWPFFLLSDHTRCYWRGNPKGCIHDNQLILNTKPDPWVIQFTDDGFNIIASGTDAAGQTAANFDTTVDYDEDDPFILEYNDGNGKYGELRIFYEKNAIVLQLFNVAFNGYPRSCNKGTLFGAACGDYECEGQVIDIRNKGDWTWYSCPHCFRNIACGIMGKYIRGDCTTSELTDSSNECYNILTGSDGVVYAPPVGDAIFGQFADTWKKDVVDAAIEAAGYSVNYLGERDEYAAKHRESMLDGRDLTVDIGRLGGDCANNPERVAYINETCRANTWGKYKKCCNEIGLCDIFWNACIEDLCSCADPLDVNKPENITEAWCLDYIIHGVMNTTCSVDALYPTAAPSGAPTPAPTGIVEGLPKGEAAGPLVWFFLIFAIIFVIIACGAYVWYRKKNGAGNAYFDDNVGPTAVQ